MKKRLQILHLEDNVNDAELIQSELGANDIDCDIVRVDTRDGFLAALESGAIDIILADYKLPSFDGITALSISQVKAAGVPFIFVSGTIGEELAVATLKSGAVDYVLKGHLARLSAAVRRALDESEQREARKRAEERYRNLVQDIDAIVWEADARTWQFSFVSKHAETVLGYPADRWLVEPGFWAEHIHPVDRDRAVAQCKRATEEGKDHEFEYRAIAADGRVVWIRDSVRVIRDHHKIPKILRGLMVDVTARKRIEERLREQADLINIDPDAILVVDIDGRILFWNKGAEDLYGWKREEVIGERMEELLFAKEAERFREASLAVQRKGVWHGEIPQMSKNGSHFLVESRWTLSLDKDGKPRIIYIVNTDITERKKLEANFLRAQRMESIGTLAGGIAHDLNNVLSPVLLYLNTLRPKLPDDQSQKTLDALEGTVQRGAGLIRQVLNFARGVEGERYSIESAHLVREIDDIVRGTFPKSIRAEISLPKNLWNLSGDPTQLHQVLLNLCVNARDAMPRGGKLMLSAENVLLDQNYAKMHLDARAGPYVVLTVEDTGEGIAPHVIEKIFDPFFTTKRIGKGTGLGLSSVLTIVKSHGGFVNVYSEVGKGSKFKVYLPAAKTAAAEEVRKERVEMPVGNGELVLLVDDEAAIREISRQTLEDFGYRVLTAADGAEAVVVYTKHKDSIKVVITDMMMPIMDGRATMHALRRINGDVRIITASGIESNLNSVEAQEVGVRAVLPKPYTAEKLLTTLREVLDRKSLRFPGQ